MSFTAKSTIANYKKNCKLPQRAVVIIDSRGRYEWDYENYLTISNRVTGQQKPEFFFLCHCTFETCYLHTSYYILGEIR